MGVLFDMGKKRIWHLLYEIDSLPFDSFDLPIHNSTASSSASSHQHTSLLESLHCITCRPTFSLTNYFLVPLETILFNQFEMSEQESTEKPKDEGAAPSSIPAIPSVSSIQSCPG